jgi:three-Cys-motif partner protein
VKKPTESSIDEIGPWSEVKLDLIDKYARAYSMILSKQLKFYHVYIDGFAGPGVNLTRSTGGYVRAARLTRF